jgi:trans enoyl reductase
MTATGREFDIVLYGATGFVGRLTAEYLARVGAGARIALAGRSPDRLPAIRDTLGEARTVLAHSARRRGFAVDSE